ncbi:MAG: hypothetical protein KF819_20935 [Labilithrix sp.]|nr:hypothetical protein [Labilithrix sp.]
MMLAPTPRLRQRTPAPAPRGKRTLASILREHGGLESAVAVDLVFEICDALTRAHAEGVVHGDLGAHCVRLAWPPDPLAGLGEVEIFSLGDDADRISMITARPNGAWSMEKSATLAPEQRVVGQRVDARADVWAVGALVRTMLRGDPPRTLQPLVAACLAPDPAERPQTIEEVAEKIASYASSPPDCYARLAHWRATIFNRAAVEKAETTAAAIALERLDRFALDRARGPHASELADVADVEDDDDAMPTTLHASAYENEGGVPLAASELSPLITPQPVMSPLATPAAIPSGFLAPPEPSQRELPAPAPQRRKGLLLGVVVFAAIACVVLGITTGFVATRSVTAVTATESAPSAELAPPPVAAQPPREADAVPTITPASLPEAPIPTFTPASLPEARARRR